MKKWILLALLAALGTQAQAKPKIQNEDVKSLNDLTTAVLTTTGNLGSGSPCISSIGSLAGLVTGLYVYDTTSPSAIPTGTTILAIPGGCSAGQVQLSASATANRSGDTITFGGTISQLINDTKIYVTANGYDTTLKLALENNIPTNPMTTLGDMIYGGSGGSQQRLGIGSSGQYLLVSGGIPTWGIPTVNANTFWAGPISGGAAPATFRAIVPQDRPLSSSTQTSSFAVPAGVDEFSCGGAALTATLPSVASSPGRLITFYKTDSSFTNVISIAPAGGDTINGGSGKSLNTFGESLSLLAPSTGGTNWLVVGHSYPSNAVTYGVNVTGTVSNPSTGTVTLNNGFYRRVSDDSLLINWQYTQSSAGSSGSGVYMISIPGGLSISTGFNTPDSNGQSAVVGGGYLESNNGTANTAASVFVYDSTHLGILIGNTGTLWGSGTGFDYGQANITKFSIYATVSISGWN